MDAITALHRAASLARQTLGATSPNPSVGAVGLDVEGQIVAEAVHEKAGSPHAEIVLLELCRKLKKIDRLHTLVVTLEPCNHQGKTPPCTDALLNTSIKNFLIGTLDPNPQVKGGGFDRLRQAGRQVELAPDQEECLQLIHSFSSAVRLSRPFVTLKRAFTRDYTMIPPSGQKTFTDPSSLKLAHRLRKKADAILTGSGTILADHPLFTVRHVKDYLGKKRLLGILDRRQRVPSSYVEEANERGLQVHIYSSPLEAIQDLYGKGAQDILVEAGPNLSKSLLDQGLQTMLVDIHAGTPDKVDVTFNPGQNHVFNTQAFRWDYFLPEESEQAIAQR